MHYFFAIMIAAVLAGCSTHSGPKTALDECSRLAEPAPVPEQHFVGVQFDNLEADKAIRACGAKLEADPSDPHTQYLLARALTKKKDYLKAYALAEQSCAAGAAAACSLIGGYYHHGFPPVKLDWDKALSLYEQACAGGSPSGCLNTANMHINGLKQMEDPALGAKLMFETCQNGFYPACQRYTNAVYFEKIPMDEAKYLFAASRECESGLGCFLFWEIFETKKDESSLRQRFEVTKKACENGFYEACQVAGDLYYQGSGVTKDDEAALKMMEKACDAGRVRSCESAGFMLVNVLERDTDRGLAMIDGACRAGYDWACYDLGRLYLARPELANDDNAARELFAFACNKTKHIRSCDALRALEAKK